MPQRTSRPLPYRKEQVTLEVTQASNSARRAPATDAKQAPRSEPKTAQENTVANQAPKETKAAVATTFGKIPSGAAPKTNLVIENPADPKTARASSLYGDNDPKHKPGDYAKSADGKNNVVQDGKGNAYAINDRGNFATTADNNRNPIVFDKTLGGKSVAVDGSG